MKKKTPARGPRVFDYTAAQWQEIDAAIANVRKAPLTPSERDGLVKAARAYKSPRPVQSARAKNWRRVARNAEALKSLFETCRKDCDYPVGYEDYSRYLTDLKKDAELEARGSDIVAVHRFPDHILKALDEGRKIDNPYVTVTKFSRRSEDDPRRQYYQSLAEMWLNLGGTLSAWWDDIHGEVRGDVVQFFVAATKPVMGRSAPSVKSLPRIIRRQRAYHKRVQEGDERKPASWEIDKSGALVGIQVII